MGEHLETLKDLEVKYPRWWIVVGIPIIVFLGTVLGTPHTFADSILYIKMLCNLSIGAGAWAFFLFTIIRLDKTMPWHTTSHRRRWWVQLGITLPIMCLFDGFSTYGLNLLMGFEFSLHRVLYTDMPIVLALSVGVQWRYQRYFMKQAQKHRAAIQTEAEAPSASPAAPEELWLSKGGTKYRVTPDQLAYCYRKNDLNYWVFAQGESHLMDQSLAHVEESFASADMFRVNRQLLVHRQAVKGYQTLTNRQTVITLIPDWEDEALLNKNRLAAFKRWIQSV
ncbi:MAG: LytTR family transcriptional regulator DNA-binding domain-containing protein [Bacteroidota bacterium]